MHPVRVRSGDGLPGCDGDVCARRRAGRVAGEGVVGDFEDGVVGGPFALDPGVVLGDGVDGWGWGNGHPGRGVLHVVVAVGIVAVGLGVRVGELVGMEEGGPWVPCFADGVV